MPDNEAEAGRIYFREYAKSIPEKYEFYSRNQAGIGNSKRRAGDVINGLLNYGYSVLAGEISKYVCGIGLDPYFGFLHKTHTGYQPLVYDIMEPFRWLVDFTVFLIATNTSTKQRILLKEYAHTRDGNVVIEYSLIKRFLELLERQFSQEIKYESRYGKKTVDGLKSVSEIAIAKIMIQNLAEYCIGKQKAFEVVDKSNVI